MASLGLAFGAWGLPWESGDAPGIEESRLRGCFCSEVAAAASYWSKHRPEGGLAAPGSEKQKWAFK